MKIPNAERACVDIRKLRNYCLSMDHPRGKHKARVFRLKLGLTAEDAEELKETLLTVVKTQFNKLLYSLKGEVTYDSSNSIIRCGGIN